MLSNITPRLHELRPSATLVINELSAQLSKEGKKIYRFGFGQSPFPVPKSVVESLKNHAHEKAYLPVKGLAELRQAVAAFNRRTLGIDSTGDQVLIGPGSKELIFLAQMAYNGSLLLPAPSWVSYQPQAQIVDKEVEWLSCFEKDKWLLRPDILEAACLKNPEKPKMLILNYPSNPTGVSFDSSSIQAIAEVAKRHKILVVADEIYGEVHHQDAHISIAKYYPEGTIISSGLSKWCGAGGWRLGTLSFPSELKWLQDMIAIMASETYSTASAPIQYAAITAFNGNEEISTYLNHSKKILGTVGNYVHQQLSQIGITMPTPEGGFYLFPNFEKFRNLFEKNGVKNSKDMCHFLLKETGVALLPGVDFGRPSTELTTRLAFVDFDGEALLNVLSENPDITVDEDFVKKHCPNIKEGMEQISRYLSTS